MARACFRASRRLSCRHPWARSRGLAPTITCASRWEFTLPSARFAWLQLVLSATNWAVIGGVLYVLADADTHIESSEGVNVIRMPEHYGVLSPILHVVPLQLLSYHTACARGTDVDKPRNLAKSVTVE